MDAVTGIESASPADSLLPGLLNEPPHRPTAGNVAVEDGGYTLFSPSKPLGGWDSSSSAASTASGSSSSNSTRRRERRSQADDDLGNGSLYVHGPVSQQRGSGVARSTVVIDRVALDSPTELASLRQLHDALLEVRSHSTRAFVLIGFTGCLQVQYTDTFYKEELRRRNTLVLGAYASIPSSDSCRVGAGPMVVSPPAHPWPGGPPNKGPSAFASPHSASLVTATGDRRLVGFLTARAYAHPSLAAAAASRAGPDTSASPSWFDWAVQLLAGLVGDSTTGASRQEAEDGNDLNLGPGQAYIMTLGV
jgi:hypothetical protein